MKNRVQYFSNLRAIACIAIVILHTCLLGRGLYAPTGAVAVATVAIRNCMLWAVPCFVMVTGALLLDPSRKVPIKKVYTVYLKRIVLTLIVFTVLFELFDSILMIRGIGSGEFSVGGFFKGIFEDFFFNTGWPHMWYLYMLIGIYIMLPMYRVLARHAGDQMLRYMLLVYFVFLAVLPNIETLIGRKTGFYILAYTIYPFYLFLGWAFHFESMRISTKAAAFLTVMSTALIVVLTCAGTHFQSEVLMALVNNYSFVGVIGQSLGFFALMKNVSRDEESKVTKILAKIDQQSFGIYLLHVLVLNIIYKVCAFNPYAHGGIVALVLIAIITLVCSYVLTAILRKIQLLRNIL